METKNPDAKPERETGKIEQQGGESQPGPAALLPVAEPFHSEAKVQDVDKGRDETDSDEDKAFNKLADAEAEQTNWERMQGKWTRIGAVTTASLGLATFLLLFHQTCTLRKQLESMQSSSKDTQEMIKAMQKQADATDRQVNIMTEQFRESHRPWVSLDSEPKIESVKLASDGRPINMIVTFALKNAGDSPAIATFIEAKLVSRGSQPEGVDAGPYCEPKELVKKYGWGNFGEFIIPGIQRRITQSVVRIGEPQGADTYLVGCVGYTGDAFYPARKKCVPYAMSFVGKFTDKKKVCDSMKAPTPCFENGGWGDTVPGDMKPEDCPE